MFNLTKSNIKRTSNEQHPGDGGAAALGAAEGTNPAGSGGCGCDGPMSVQAGGHRGEGGSSIASCPGSCQADASGEDGCY